MKLTHRQPQTYAHWPTWMTEAKQGNLTHYNKLFSELHDLVYRFYVKHYGDNLPTADLTQETLMTLHTKLKSFDENANLRSWVLSIARNKAIDYWRKHKHESTTEHYDTLMDPMETDALQTLLDELPLTTSAQLPKNQLRAFVLVKVFGYSCAEVARKFSTTEGAIKARVRRATQALQWQVNSKQSKIKTAVSVTTDGE